MTSAKLFLLGMERELLWVDTNYYRYVARDGSPSSNLEGGLLRLSFVSQESDDVFWHNMVKKVDQETERMEKGEIHFYSKGNEDSAIRKYKFNDAYLIEFSEIFHSWGTENMQIILTISPAIQNYGYSQDFVKHWQVSSLPTQPICYQPKEETEDRIIYINGHFYNKDGTFEGKINEPDFEGSVEDVYVCDGKSTQKNKNGNDLVTYNNTKLLKENDVKITHEKFINLASIAYGECSLEYNLDVKWELFAIAYVNFKHQKNVAYGKDSAGAISFRKRENKKRNGTVMQTAIAAVINALTNGTDYSNGADSWDGVDVLTGRFDAKWKQENHFRQRVHGKRKGITDPKNLSPTFYSNVKEALQNKISNPKTTESLQKDYQNKLDNLKDLIIYKEEYEVVNKQDKLKYTPCFEILSTHAGSIFYKELK
ncbi:type VI secretion system tube protein TssD [Flavobacterium sp. MMLR14_040]|uniref:type VI secretion system tube protein TssD n=1 Tax=Flavobacterium sp. MMLR14_040 TaxID=3093843 RepID=UPI00298FC4EA|nr:type VI secretion system tube protein TssD [Flavobacterium sp. MMLR14_040]MDW8850499.1 type VI secretion system tube protein TssD [Flavobacterium sp. MMLR14_040]